MLKLLLTCASLFLLWVPNQFSASGAYQQAQQTVTLVVHHDECTSCEDLTVDSGTVRIPSHLRQAFIDNQLRYRRGGPQPSRDQLLAAYNSQGYAVSSLDLNSEAVFDSLFSVPGRTITLYQGATPESYPWDFDRKYRITGQIIAIQGKVPIFKIQQAVLLRTSK
jgi:hypothetical protein